MTDAPQTSADMLYAGVQLTRPLLRNITARVEADLASSGITVGQRAILEALLSRPSATAPELTALLQLKRQFVARELKELLAKGMVCTEANARHSRSHYYRLTDQSRHVIEQIRDREMAEFARFAARFTPEEIAAYLKIQTALNAALSDH